MKLRTIVAAMVAALSIATFTPAQATEQLQTTIGASPQLQMGNGSCSSQVIYSHRDEKSGKVKSVLLTADHCVRDNPKYEINVDFPIYEKGKIVRKVRFIGTVLGEAYSTDLALIQLKDDQTLLDHVVKIAKNVDDMQIGDPITTIGYPLGLNINVTQGTYAGYQTGGDKEWIHATSNIIFGNSGGGLYRVTSSGDYELIGVADAVIDPYTFMGFYVPVDQIRDYLKVALPEAIGEKSTSYVVSPTGH